jgi:hypothetical protein
MPTVRQLMGTLIKDLPLYLPALIRGGDAVLSIRNRDERLQLAPDGSGYRCQWQWTSDLHAPKVIPALGRCLMRRSLSTHPILRSKSPVVHESSAPSISFLIGHRGESRIAHLLATLESIAAQEDVQVECVVVEQDVEARLATRLPPWVRLIHTPPPSSSMPFCRSWAFNVAARYARSPVLVLHDNDMLLPTRYAAEILSKISRGYDMVNLKRFIFYLAEQHTQSVFSGRAGLFDEAPEAVVQNLQAGGSVAITRSGFEQIGGMDESFVGWGGEDNEFWERAQALRVWPWATMPLVHLYHPAQPGKHNREYPTAQRYLQLSLIDPLERSRRLNLIPRGVSDGPAQSLGSSTGELP